MEFQVSSNHPSTKNSLGPILIDAKDVAKLLSCSERHVRRMDAGAEMPAPVRIGRSVRWRKEEISQWVKNDCPSRAKWEQIKSNIKS